MIYVWNNSGQNLFILEAIIAILGVIVGVFARKRNWLIILLLAADVFSLLIYLSAILYGIREEYMILPFFAEMLILGTSLALVIMLAKCRHK